MSPAIITSASRQRLLKRLGSSRFEYSQPPRQGRKPASGGPKGLFVGRILLLSVNTQIGSQVNVSMTTIQVLIWVEMLVAIGLGFATLGFLFSVARKQGVAMSGHGSQGD